MHNASSKSPTLIRIAASTIVLGLTMTSCKPAADASRPRSASQAGARPEQLGGDASQAALAAVARQDFAEAVRLAETAVALVPRNAGYRATLAEFYLKSGRFDSAATAYRDALRLNPQDSRSRLSLALTEIGLGENVAALATLGSADGRIASADLGLALALAGDRQGAIRLLSTAARQNGATGRVRQNLALAHALAGDWMQARTIAAQDVGTDELDARMAFWALFAAPKQSYDQVATLLGVQPVADAGQPARLALIEVPPEAAPAKAAEVIMPSAPAYVAPQAATVAATVDDARPVAAAPVIAATLAGIQRVLPPQMARAVTRTIRAAASAPASLKGRYVVQIGAFSDTESVERAWNDSVGKLDRLADYAPASTRFTVGRGTLTRLSVGGFATRLHATDLCDSLRRAGGNCFVRAMAGDAPVRWASRPARNG